MAILKTVKSLKLKVKKFNAKNRILIMPLLLLFTFYFSLFTFGYAERIKDIASFEGVRENQLLGYGLVVGINGTGDKGLATLQGIANMLQRMGITVKPRDIMAKNTAAVMVTATLPPFPKPGSKVDALVSTLGDAKSLQGGTLILTPLKGPDSKVYALAQGPVSIGGFTGGGGGNVVQKNHPTAGKVPQGVIVEQDLHFTLGNGDEIKIFLHQPDFTTATTLAKKVNETLNFEYASTIDPSAVRLKIPPAYMDKKVEFITLIEGLDISVDIPARIVINERTGTVVIGDKVRISPVAIAHGNLTIEIKTEFGVSQPPPFAPEKAKTVVVPQTDVTAKEQKASLMEVSGTTLGEIVRALNALGVTPRDLIAILQALKASGSLKAELEII
ncbi:MAG TPA: flagellar basal body P-ring protein FlgI [Thermodesulfovibrionales bacterium]|nr:flagellar basal body P-ring protein FlgI [Thermodesulfovibrionales bacterium]